MHLLGNKPYYIFENGQIKEHHPKLPTWQFGIDNDKLVELVLKGIKTAYEDFHHVNYPDKLIKKIINVSLVVKI